MLHSISRPAFFSILLFAFTVSALAQVDIRGVLSTKPAPVPNIRPHGGPSTVTPPGPNGNSRGVSSTPAKPAPAFHRVSVRLPVPFGDPHRRGREIIAIPLFYPVYLYPNNSAAPQEQQAAADNSSPSDDEAALQEAYNRGAQDALAQQNRNPQRSFGTTSGRQTRRSRASAIHRT
jgi:hypothetical protein